MPRSYPPLPDVRVTDPDNPPVIDTVQAVTGGSAPYCRRCGAWTTVQPESLDGLLDIPAHDCDTTPETGRRDIVGALPTPFA